MNNKFPSLIVYFLLAIFLYSCTSSVYTPISSEVLAVSKKGEMNGAIRFNAASTIQSTITYSPINNIAISVNNVAGAYHNSGGAAIGYYTKPIFDNYGINTFFDAYLGYSYHKQILEVREFYNIDVLYNKLYTQFGFHSKTKNLELNFQSQFSIVDYSKIIHNTNDGFINQYFNHLASEKFFTSLEVSPSICYGLRHAKVMLGGNVALFNNNRNFVRGNAFIGFTFNLNHLF